MQLTASAPVATSLWIATIVFTGLVVVGLCCVFTYFWFYLEFKKESKTKFGNWNCILKKGKEVKFLQSLIGTIKKFSLD